MDVGQRTVQDAARVPAASLRFLLTVMILTSRAGSDMLVQSQAMPIDAVPPSPSGENRQPGRPELVFRPDPRKTARLALLGRSLMWAALVILGLGVYILVRYRPGPMVAAERGGSVPLPGFGSLPAADSAVLRPQGVDSISLNIREVQAGLRLALGLWQRTAVVKPVGPVTAENAAQVLDQVNAALTASDSASRAVARARDAIERLDILSRSLAPAEAYRLSALRSQVKDYIGLLEKEGKDQTARFAALTASSRAAAASDQAEAEVKENVATGYQRKSENRQKALARQAVALEDAIRRYLAGR